MPLINEEQKIIKRIADGDEHAFGTLFENTSKSVFQYILRFVNNREVAEDILIETYIKVWNSANKFKGDSSVFTWILGIARNLTMNEIRKRDYRLIDLTDNKFISAEQINSTCQKEISEIISKALTKLSPKHREVLDLIFIQELTYEEISILLNIPINTVKTRIFYAKEEIRKILTNMGVNKDELF